MMQKLHHGAARHHRGGTATSEPEPQNSIATHGVNYDEHADRNLHAHLHPEATPRAETALGPQRLHYEGIAHHPGRSHWDGASTLEKWYNKVDVQRWRMLTLWDGPPIIHKQANLRKDSTAQHATQELTIPQTANTDADDVMMDDG